MYIYKGKKYWSLNEIRYETQISFPETEEGMELMGITYEEEPIVPPTKEDLARDARFKRDDLLKESDWAILPDSPLSESKKAEWMKYRQELRDVPQQVGFPENIQWPIEPGKGKIQDIPRVLRENTYEL